MKNSNVTNKKEVPPQLYDLSTASFAAGISNSPGSVRKNFSILGHHLGAKPLKLANGRLMWASEDLKSILSKGSAK